MRDSMLLITGKLSTVPQGCWQVGQLPHPFSLPDKFARFLYEFHDFRFTSLDLRPLPADRSIFDVHGAINTDQVWILLYQCACV
jgi:hypothetical protein